MSLLEIVNYFLKASLSLAFLYSFYFFILKGQHCFNFIRFYMLASLLFSIALPLFNVFTLQISAGRIIDPSVLIMPEVIILESALPSTSFSLLSFIIILYALGVLIMIIRFGYSLYKIVSFIAENQALGVEKNGYHLINTYGKYSTASFFNYILWDNSQLLSFDEKSLILKHEQIHVNQKHSWDIILIEFILIIFWVNPIVWLIKSNVLENHEYLADSSSHHTIDAYSSLLAKQSLQQQGIHITHAYGSSSIFKRIKMLRQSNKITPNYKYIVVMFALVFVFFTFSFTIKKDNDSVSDDYILLVEKQIKKLKMDDSEIFTLVDHPAEPIGGMTTFYTYVAENLIFPTSAITEKKEGIVYIEFIVEKDGAVSSTKVIKGFHPECNVNALKVITNAPKWNPAIHNNILVRQKIVLPISYKLT